MHILSGNWAKYYGWVEVNDSKPYIIDDNKTGKKSIIWWSLEYFDYYVAFRNFIQSNLESKNVSNSKHSLKNVWDKLKIFENRLHDFYHLTNHWQDKKKTRLHRSEFKFWLPIDISYKFPRKLKAGHLIDRHIRLLGTAISRAIILLQKY